MITSLWAEVSAESVLREGKLTSEVSGKSVIVPTFIISIFPAAISS